MSKVIQGFMSDRPIEQADEDALDRAPFAESLGQAILGWKHKDSLVIGLYGSWGFGKSSIVSLCVQYLEADKRSCPTVVHFNPWLLTNTEALIGAFFRDLEIGIRHSCSKDKEKEISQLMHQFHLALIGLPVILTVLQSAGIDCSELSKFIPAIASLPVAAQLKRDVLEPLQKITDEMDKSSAKQAMHISLVDTKKKLFKLLRSLKKPVLLIIDDIDRLQPEQIRMMVQLVKATCDFPNIIYLLCFERNVIEKALNEDPLMGREFLEKIVQIGIDIPAIERDRLVTISENHLLDILHQKHHKFDTTDKRWKELKELLGVRFKNLRQVKRFLNSFNFLLSLFSGPLSLEINLIDLIAIEILRVFEPDVYKKLYHSKNQIFDPVIRYQLEKKPDRIAEYKKQFEELTQNSTHTSTQAILTFLFPYTSWLYDKSTGRIKDDEQWLANSNICHEFNFDRYFLLCVPRWDISSPELKSLIGSLNSQQKFAKKLQALQKNSQINLTLARLAANQSSIAPKVGANYMAAIMDIAEDLPDPLVGRSIVSRYLSQFENFGQRLKLLLPTIEQTKGLNTLAQFARDVCLSNSNDSKGSLLDIASGEKFKIAVAQRFEMAADTGELLNHKNVSTIVYWWAKCSSSGKAREWVQKQTTSKNNFIKLFGILLKIKLTPAFLDDPSAFLWPDEAKWLKDWFNTMTELSQVQKLSLEYLQMKDLTEHETLVLKVLEKIIVWLMKPNTTVEQIGQAQIIEVK